LAPIAAAIVRELVARAERLKSPWLFASAMPGYHHKYATPAQASETIRRVCKAISAAHFDQLDLRRTCETQLAALGVSSDLRAQILSHALGTVADRHYQRHEFMVEKLAALRQWELHVMPAAAHS
jgi:integrase